MSKTKTYLAANDKIQRLSLEADSLDEATILTGHGAYAVFRLYEDHKALYLESHLNRIRRSMRSLGEPYELSNTWLRARLDEAVKAGRFKTPRVRLTVPYEAPDTAVITLEPFRPPTARMLEKGVKACLYEGCRTDPTVKDSRFVEKRAEIRDSVPKNCYEVFLVNEDGRILEGLSSNVFAIRNGILYTAGEGMLSGIARRLVLEVAPAILPISMKAISLSDLESIKGAFLTSSSRGPVPVVKIGRKTIGDGRPGETFKAIRAAYDRRVESALQPIIPA